MKQKILVIDDEESMVQLLRLGLEREGYHVLSAPDGVQGLLVLQDQWPDLIVLDLMMPRMDGWEVCRRIRECTNAPIIMLTAMGTDESKVHGLSLGADDYVTKPFGMAELVARVGAALRRYRYPLTKCMMVKVGDHFVLDRAHGHVRVDGRRVELTPIEHRILTCFLDNPDRVLTHQSLLTQVWGWEYMDDVDYLKVYIHHLRKKIERDPQRPRYILTERGLGYRFRIA
jgi:two-component system KDP operon response regulator KdpE